MPARVRGCACPCPTACHCADSPRPSANCRPRRPQADITALNGAIEDLQAWVSRGEKNSTSDDTGDEVLPAKRHAAISPAYARKARS